MWQIIDVYFGILIMTVGIFLFARIILEQKIKIKKIKFIRLLFLISLFFLSVYFHLEGLSKTLIIFLITASCYKYTFKIDGFKALFLSFFYIVMLIIPDLLSLFFVTVALNINKTLCYKEIAGGLLSNALVLFILMILTLILKRPIQNIISNKISNDKKLLFLSIMTMISMLMFFYTIIEQFKVEKNIIVYMISLIVMVFILFCLIKQMIENNNLCLNYDNLLEYMVTYEEEIENQRITRHEAKNELRIIRAMNCEKQKTEEIIEYIDEILNDKYEVKKEKYAKFGYFPANGIKGFLYFKTNEAENKGIKLSVNISKKIKESVIYNLDIKQQRDFMRILGVILDNAIDASLESKEKKLGIEAYVTEEKGFKFIISNTYNNIIDKNKIGKEKFSTKGNNRGHGLLLVNKIIKKNNMFQIEQEKIGNIYVSTIIIKNN